MLDLVAKMSVNEFVITLDVIGLTIVVSLYLIDRYIVRKL